MKKVDFSSNIEFAGYSDDDILNKADVIGEQLWNKLFERNPKFGGVTCGFYGVPGSGKTSLMLQICKKIIKTKPNEYIFWREPWGVPVQITNLGLPVNIWSNNGKNTVIKKLTDKKAIDTEDYSIRPFRDIEHLLRRIKPGVINLIYFKDRKGWLRLIRKMKGNLSWQSFFLDECEDIFSSRVGGKDWHLNEEFCSDIKELRKARISMYLNSQTDWDIDPRIKAKFMLECYLYGAKKNKHSPLYRGVLQDLELGEGWITYAHALFGKINFNPVEPLDKQYITLPNV